VAVGGGAEPAAAVGQQMAPPVAAVAGVPISVGNLAIAQQPAHPSAQPAMLRAPAPPPPPPARAPQPGARAPAPYTLQPAAPRYAPQAPPAAPAPAPLPPPEPEQASGYEQGGYGEAQASARPAAAPRPAQPRPAARPAEPRIPGRSATLFAEPPPVPPPAAPRASLFGRVTGAFRGQPAEPPPAPPQPHHHHRAEATQHEFRGEPARASVRQASGDDASIDIPAFLRRQSS
jgi:hypothetical protein